MLAVSSPSKDNRETTIKQNTASIYCTKLFRVARTLMLEQPYIVVLTAHAKWRLCRLLWCVGWKRTACAIFQATTRSKKTLRQSPFPSVPSFVSWKIHGATWSVTPTTLRRIRSCPLWRMRGVLFLHPGNVRALHFGLSFFPNLVEEELWRKASISSFC